MNKIFAFEPKNRHLNYHLCESRSQIEREIESYAAWEKRADHEKEKPTVEFILKQIDKLAKRLQLLVDSDADFYVTGFTQEEISTGDFFSIYHKYKQYDMMVKKVSRRDHSGVFKNPEHKINSFFEVLGIAHSIPQVTN